MDKEKPLAYTPESESKWQKFWEENQIYKFDPNSSKPIYSIDTPPPTVSGQIHIWHIFSYTQAEVIARFKKIMGYNLFYPFWFDDNWLPTERLVEKEIWKKAVEMDRLEFNQECLKITKLYREKFKKLWQSMGFSVDWNLAYSTISPEVQKISQHSFLDLIKKEIIFQKDSPALWCTECQTAVAQAEVEDKEIDSVFYDVEFNLEDWSPIIIATTRPELLPSCLAVFVNPEDTRYANLIWKNIITPLWDKVKILSDEKAKIDKWTWVVMCCSYWDETDIYWANKYSLWEKIILDKAWKITNSKVEGLDWLHVKKARHFIVEMLKSNNKIISEKNIKHDVWVHERCSTPMEIITVKQWFINILDIKEKLIKAWEKINWKPKHMKKRYLEWVENLKWDWCISRQRYFWIPIPVWYSKKTWEIILPDISQLPVDPLKDRPKNLPDWHTYDDITEEKDVLDTWATSSLTPLINSNFYEKDNLNEKILPFDLRPQAHDIIRTWALYTIVKSLYHTGEIPFKDIMISWHVLASKSEKFSKSKDNAKITPEELIKKYWADPIRYWACGWSLGKDVVFDEKEIENGRRLVIKLLNASRFAVMNLWDFNPKEKFDFANLQNIDKWIINRSKQVADQMKIHFESFEFWHAIIEFEKFFWKDFCDNYLEISKNKIYSFWKFENWEINKKSAQIWLYNALLNILKLISPILPHITEELYQNYFRKFEETISIHNEKYPSWIDKDNLNTFNILDSEVRKLFELIDLIRKYKTENKIKFWQEMKDINIWWTTEEIEVLKKFTDDIKSISKTSNVNFNIWDVFKCEILN